MVFVITCCIIAVLLAQLKAMGIYENGLKASFLLLTTIAAIQFNFGMDYWNYYSFFTDYIVGTHGTLESYLAEYGSKKNEWGWIILQLLFKPFGNYGFFLLVAFISVIENLAFYKLITKYVDSSWYGFAMFLYVISNRFFVLNLSMLRQGLAIALFLLIVPRILKKQIIVPLVTVLVASTIHKSALILLPAVFIGWIPMKKASLFIWIYLSIFFLQFIFPSIPRALSEWLSSFEDVNMYLTNYSDFGSIKYSYGIGFLITIIPFIIAMYYLSKYALENEEISRMILLSSISFILMPMETVIALSSRLGFYFSALSIATIPITYKRLSDATLRTLCIIIVIAINIMGFVIHFQVPDLNNDTSAFHTIFEVIFK